jgi:hypothetical protein
MYIGYPLAILGDLARMQPLLLSAILAIKSPATSFVVHLT